MVANLDELVERIASVTVAIRVPEIIGQGHGPLELGPDHVAVLVSVAVEEDLHQAGVKLGAIDLAITIGVRLLVSGPRVMCPTFVRERPDRGESHDC